MKNNSLQSILLEALAPVFIFIQRCQYVVQLPEVQKTISTLVSVLEQIDKLAVQVQLFMAQEEKNGYLYAKNGWFPFPHIPLNAIGFNINEDNINSVMEKEIEEALDEIEKYICDLNADRALIIKDAFEAHRDGKYTLSIPVFLAQADGIANETVGAELFSRHKDRELQGKIEKTSDRKLITASWLNVLTNTDASIRADDRKINNDILNRHAVIHGKAINYDTKLNSLRAISLVASVSFFLKDTQNSTCQKKTAEQKQQ